MDEKHRLLIAGKYPVSCCLSHAFSLSVTRGPCVFRRRKTSQSQAKTGRIGSIQLSGARRSEISPRICCGWHGRPQEREESWLVGRVLSSCFERAKFSKGLCSGLGRDSLRRSMIDVLRSLRFCSRPFLQAAHPGSSQQMTSAIRPVSGKSMQGCLFAGVHLDRIGAHDLSYELDLPLACLYALPSVSLHPAQILADAKVLPFMHPS